MRFTALRQRRLILLVIGLTLPSLSGCLILPFWYMPNVQHTPEVSLGADGHDVHAFQGMTSSTRLVGSFTGTAPGHSLQEIPISMSAAGPVLPAQHRVNQSYGMVFVLFIVGEIAFVSESSEVRLYRPGYELVNVDAKAKAYQVQWQPAQTIADQERVLDNLYGDLETLASGSISEGHKRSLLYGAEEYERLSGILSSPDTELTSDQSRLRFKSEQLRQLALRVEEKKSTIETAQDKVKAANTKDGSDTEKSESGGGKLSEPVKLDGVPGEDVSAEKPPVRQSRLTSSRTAGTTRLPR